MYFEGEPVDDKYDDEDMNVYILMIKNKDEGVKLINNVYGKNLPNLIIEEAF